MRRVAFNVEKMKSIQIQISICFLSAAVGNLQGQVNKPGAADKIFAYVKSHVPKANRIQLELNDIGVVSGQYTDLPPGMHSLGIDDLYLFPDDTYFYVEWTDVFPRTITDRGRWSYKDGLIELCSDRTLLKGAGRRNAKFLPLNIEKDGKKLNLLLGTEGDFAYFKRNAKANDEFMLILCTYNQKVNFATTDYEQTKAEVYNKCWRPERAK